eukprot:711997_1
MLQELEIIARDNVKNSDNIVNINQVGYEEEGMKETVEGNADELVHGGDAYDNKKIIPNILEMQTWLQDEVKLPQYFDVLVKNGYESMDIIKEISHVSELKDIG